MSGLQILMINPNQESVIPEDVFKYKVPDKFHMGKDRLSGQVIECSMKELTGVDETYIICRICFKCLHRPTTLPCLHIFCLHCLYGFVREYGMVCPLCMQQFPGGRDLSLLPKNSFSYHTICVAIAGKQIDDSLCKICSLKPDVFCYKCDVYLCELCLMVCHKVKGRENHSVSTVTKYKEEVTGKEPDCVEHNLALSGFCYTCKLVICEECDGHKNHRIKSVEYGFDYYKKTTGEMLVRYPYEKSLLYKSKVQKGLPLYPPPDVEQNYYENLGTELTGNSNDFLSKEEVEKMQRDLENKTFATRMTDLIQSQTTRKFTDVVDDLLQSNQLTIEPMTAMANGEPRKIAEIRINRKHFEEQSKKESHKTSESPKATGSEKANKPQKTKESATSVKDQMESEIRQNLKTPKTFRNFEEFMELLKKDAPHEILGGSKEDVMETLFDVTDLISSGRLADVIRARQEAEGKKDTAASDTKKKKEKKKEERKAWTEKEILMLNHVMGRKWSTFHDHQPINHSISVTLPKLNSASVDFDSID
ncbi:uncharacterized protein [Antedon mediterranea]|uniref:uncharacterized protein n=1 Tax=Antedon mediterranea TaxID=105859 RepID=UPI003AF5FC18